MLGKINNVEQILNKFDVFCLSSKREGMPIVLLEAAYYGLCIISTNVGGASEIVTNGFNGFLVEKNCASALSDKIDYLCKNRNKVMEFKENSITIASHNYVPKMVEKYMGVLRKNG